MSEYSESLRDPRWQRKRLEVLERDSFTCRECRSSDKTLNVHHLMYTGRAPWMTPSFALLTLCEDCHKEQSNADHQIAKNSVPILWDPLILFSTLGERYSFDSSDFQELAYALCVASRVAPERVIQSIVDIALQFEAADHQRLRYFAQQFQNRQRVMAK